MNKYGKLIIIVPVIICFMFIAGELNILSMPDLGSTVIYRFSNSINSIEDIPSPVEDIPPDQLKIPDLIVLGARQEAINGTIYDASYQVIDYPGGDVPSDRGACTDVVIRAYRNAGIDLQQLIHEDMLMDFEIYPPNWGLTAPDSSIDHRRVPNQITFLKRYGNSLSLDPVNNPDDWHWGDVVYWEFANGDQHCGIISDRINRKDIPLVIHNAGICREEDALLRWEIIGHYRYPAQY